MTRPLLWAWLGLALASLCWAGNALVARAFAGDIPPFSLGFWRWALALGLLLPLAGASLWRHRQVLRRAGWRLWLAALNSSPLKYWRISRRRPPTNSSDSAQ